jgi:hypothetical protein
VRDRGIHKAVFIRLHNVQQAAFSVTIGSGKSTHLPEELGLAANAPKAAPPAPPNK